MPEGDTLHRTAVVLRAVLLGARVTAARGRPGGARLERVVGAKVKAVEARGKHLLIDFEGGLTLHTHLRMRGAWHRYRPAERWRRPAERAVAVLEVPDAVAVCFDAPVVELVETRALGLHRALAGLGPDLLADEPDLPEAVRRLAADDRSTLTVAEGLLDQTALAGLGNVYRSEVLFLESQDPFAHLGGLDEAALGRLVRTGTSLLRANAHGGLRTTVADALGSPPGPSSLAGGRGALWVYGRAGRPCRHCGTLVRTQVLGDPPRRLYWCPSCQVGRPEAAPPARPTGRARDRVS